MKSPLAHFLLCCILGALAIGEVYANPLEELIESSVEEGILEESTPEYFWEQLANEADCKNCLTYIFEMQTGLAFTHINNSSIDKKKNWNMPAFQVGAEGSIGFKGVRLGASVNSQCSPLIVPYYINVGGFLELPLNRFNGIYVQGKYYRTIPTLVTYDANDNKISTGSTNLIGVEVGTRLLAEVPASVFFMKSVDGKWTHVGVKVSVDGMSKILKKKK